MYLETEGRADVHVCAYFLGVSELLVWLCVILLFINKSICTCVDTYVPVRCTFT